MSDGKQDAVATVQPAQLLMPGKTGNTPVQTFAAEQGTFPSMYFCRRDKDRGGRLVLDINSRFNTTLLKLLSVRRTKKP